MGENMQLPAANSIFREQTLIKRLTRAHQFAIILEGKTVTTSLHNKMQTQNRLISDPLINGHREVHEVHKNPALIYCTLRILVHLPQRPVFQNKTDISVLPRFQQSL